MSGRFGIGDLVKTDATTSQLHLKHSGTHPEDFPYSMKRFKFSELEDLIANGNLQIVETEKLFHEMSFYFIVAKKIQRT